MIYSFGSAENSQVVLLLDSLVQYSIIFGLARRVSRLQLGADLVQNQLFRGLNLNIAEIYYGALLVCISNITKPSNLVPY